MITAMLNKQADRVPVSPDMSNMIPCRLTGRPFWDIYLYKNPPLWKAYVDAVKHFGFDGWLTCDADVNSVFVDRPADDTRHNVIVRRTDERIITREYTEEGGRKVWSDRVKVYYVADSPTTTLARKVGMEGPPEQFWPIEGVHEQKQDEELLRQVKQAMGADGVVAVGVGCPCLDKPDLATYSIFEYVDKHDETVAWAEHTHELIMARLERILSAEVRPDVILTGSSGLLVFSTMQSIRELTLRTLQEVARRCKEEGIPSQVHCCGPEREMVKLCAEETEISNINPLEIPPMGDCDLAQIKKAYGRKISLMGNLHTTDVMLRGTPDDVKLASRKAIEDAAEGGGFILSTGDQCGRDTPDENIHAMIETAETHGRY